jgi:hypothetical protein
MQEGQVLGMAKQILCEKKLKLISAFQFKKKVFFFVEEFVYVICVNCIGVYLLFIYCKFSC